MNHPNGSHLFPAPRRAAAWAGATASLAVLGAVLMLFWSASNDDWLPPTSANAAALERCHGLSGMRPRAACVESVVRAARDEGAERRLAEAEPEIDSAQALR